MQTKYRIHFSISGKRSVKVVVRENNLRFCAFDVTQIAFKATYKMLANLRCKKCQKKNFLFNFADCNYTT